MPPAILPSFISLRVTPARWTLEREAHVRLGRWILRAWEETLAAEKKVAPQVVRAVVSQLTMATAPNADRIAEIIKRAASDGSLA
jgi:hypothetical protein